MTDRSANSREIVLGRLREHSSDLLRHGVASISIFGSVARGEASKTSDVDLLVDFDRPVGLFAFARLKAFLEHVLERRVDLVTLDAVRAEWREGILGEAIRAA